MLLAKPDVQQPPAWLVPLVALLVLLAEPAPDAVEPPDAPGDAEMMLSVPMPLGDVALPVLPDVPHGEPVGAFDVDAPEPLVAPGFAVPGAN